MNSGFTASFGRTVTRDAVAPMSMRYHGAMIAPPAIDLSLGVLFQNPEGTPKEQLA
jgi:hypothetical protein